MLPVDRPPRSSQSGRAPEETLWPAGFGAWIKMALCYQKGARHFATLLRPLDLTVPQFDALANLYVSDGISQQELAERLLVTKGNVTGLMGRLLERGLVERRGDPDDRRAYRLQLTRSGRSLARRGLEVQRELVEHLLAGLAPSEQESLRDLLSRVIARIEAAEDAVD